jgi:hypothetical protein
MQISMLKYHRLDLSRMDWQRSGSENIISSGFDRVHS